MASVLRNAADLIRSEGFVGPHSLVFLIRYSNLTDDRNLLRIVGNTLEEMDSMEESACLAYAYAEYFEACGGAGCDFCLPAVEFILSRCDEEDRMLALAYVKCARAFGREEYLDKAGALLSDNTLTARNAAFSTLAFIEMYRATLNRSYLDAAKSMSDIIRRNFHGIFNPEDSYDISCPSMNSAIALMYDELARFTQEPARMTARKTQNAFITKLAERYPSRVTFGLCALLADEFEAKTVLCRFRGETIPKSLLSVMSFYSPLTEVIAERLAENSDGSEGFYLLNNGALEEIGGL